MEFTAGQPSTGISKDKQVVSQTLAGTCMTSSTRAISQPIGYGMNIRVIIEGFMMEIVE